MKKQSKIWSIFILIEGLLLIAVGMLNLFLFRSGHYQEMIINHNSWAAVITFLSFVAVISGFYFLFYRLEIAKEIERFFKGQEPFKIVLYFGGFLSIIIGMLITFFSSFYLFYQTSVSWLSLSRFLIIMVASFPFLFYGILALISNEVMADWIKESFKRKKQPQN